MRETEASPAWQVKSTEILKWINCLIQFQSFCPDWTLRKIRMVQNYETIIYKLDVMRMDGKNLEKKKKKKKKKI